MKKAFTLIELLVGMGIFSLVMASTTGFFITALRAQRKALILREIIDNASYVLEYTGAALRMAKKDDIEIRGDSTSCLEGTEINYETTGENKIRFRNYKLNVCQEFFLESGRIKEKRDGVENFEYYLTPNDLEVTKLKFNVSGDDLGDNLQPRVTILLEIQKKGQPETKISVQTTISQRDLDL